MRRVGADPRALEWLLGELIRALARFPGVGTHVGLLSPEVFSQHRGGIGVLVCCDRDTAPGVAELLEAMGFRSIAETDLGIEAHLCGKLRPAPEWTPPVMAVPVVLRLPAAVVLLDGRRCRGPNDTSCGNGVPDASGRINRSWASS